MECSSTTLSASSRKNFCIVIMIMKNISEAFGVVSDDGERLAFQDFAFCQHF